MSLFQTDSISVGPVETVELFGQRVYVRELTIRDEAGNRIKIALHANRPDALAISEAERYAAEQSVTAMCLMSEMQGNVL
jgi:hypothetical protein